MTIRNWFKFFWNALWIGGGITGILGLFIRWDAFQPYIAAGDYGEFFAAFVWMVFLGFTMSVVAQAGFFAYLSVHQFGVNMFRSLRLWNWVQLLIITVVIFDLIFFRFKPAADTTGQFIMYLFLLLILLISAFVTARFKAKWTKQGAFISALFFMIVITTLEWLPALLVQKGNIDSWVALLLFPLLAVNAYQILMLPKFNAKSEEDRKRLEARRAERRKQQAGKGVAETKTKKNGR
ncbi:KinB-signaling pathway activation protein [Chungangia koreensis]|uniref:KinB-signaling pathway activation protein n=1 Tax=Chungangia koreensis TaxID=752657 RepID=A0ABV8X7N9_9LACT